MNISRRFLHCSSVLGRQAKESFHRLDLVARSALGDSSLDDTTNDGPQGDRLSTHLHSRDIAVEPLNAVLRIWKKEYLHSPRETLHPNHVLAKVDEWKQLLEGASPEASWKDQNNDEPFSLVRPDLSSYMYIIQAVAEGLNGQSCQPREEDFDRLHFLDTLLDRLVEDSKVDFTIQPNVRTFGVVMNAWAQSDDMTRRTNHTSPPSKRVEELLKQMKTLHAEGFPNLEPNVVVYNILLHVWAKEGKVKKIEDTLKQMIDLEIPGVSPNTISYTTLLSAYAKVGTHEAALKADSLLHQMLELYDHGMSSAKPNLVSFSNVIQCHARVGKAEKAEEWLRKLENLYQNEINNNDGMSQATKDWQPDTAIYNGVIQAWSASGQPEKAEHLLRSMISRLNDTQSKDSQSEKSSNRIVMPNSRSFNIVLAAWAKKGNAERAEATLMEMYRLHVEEDFDTRPTVVSYNTVLDAYAKKTARLKMNHGDDRRRYKSKAQNGNAYDGIESDVVDHPWSRAEAILNHMIELFEAGDVGLKPTMRTWNTVINVCAKAGEIDLAETILNRMKSFYSNALPEESNHEPSFTRTWNTLLSGCIPEGNFDRAEKFWTEMKDDGVQPDIVTYNTLLNCYVRPPKVRTKAINKVMQKQVENIFHSLSNDPNVQMNEVTYLAMVNFWINQGTPARAEAFLQDIAKKSIHLVEDDKPVKNRKDLVLVPKRDLFHYVITGWGEHKEPKKAEEVLLRMAELSDVHGLDVRPTTETYNRVLNCWAKSSQIKSGERAEVILREMEAFDALGDKDASPDIYSYNSVLNAWANSGDPTTLTRIDNLILEMLLKGKPNLLPDSFSYGTWLKAISSSKETNLTRRVTEVVKAMKVHDFHPNAFIRRRLETIKNKDKN